MLASLAGVGFAGTYRKGNASRLASQGAEITTKPKYADIPYTAP
jgi:hypothetical protein